MAGRVEKLKNGKYKFWLEIGPKGKRKRKTGTFAKRRDADLALQEAIMEFLPLRNVENMDMTFGKYLDYWLKNYALLNTAPKTYEGYSNIINNHLKPVLGDIQLTKLKATRIQAYYGEKIQSLSAQSVKHHHRLLTKAFNDAVDWEMIIKNPAKGAKAPTPQKKEMVTLSHVELQILLNVAKETTIYYPVIFTAANTGMRKGEILGLRWKDIDFETNKLYITQTIQEVNGKKMIKKSTKTGGGRVVALTAELVDMLLELKGKNEEMKKELGKSYNENNLVFVNSTGNIITASELTRQFKRVLKKAELPEIRFHDLRHTHATLLLKKMVHAKIVSERLGHSKSGTTLDIYSHVTPTIQLEAVRAFEELMREAKNTCLQI